MLDSFDHTYQAPEQRAWHGLRRSDQLDYFHQIVQLLDLRVPPTLAATDTIHFGLLGFCCDSGVIRNLGRPGAKQGPMAFRHMLANLPLHLATSIQFYDCGDIVCLDDELEAAQIQLGRAVARMRELKLHPILIGGGHEMAFGHYQGLVTPGLSDKFGIINFDAHFDLRPLLNHEHGTSGTPFLQIAQHCQQRQAPFHYTCIGIQPYANTQALFEQAKALNVHYRLAEDIILKDPHESIAFIDETLSCLNEVYVTICLDVFNTAFAPGVSAPQITGLTPWHVIPLLRHIIQTGNIISLDVAELSPTHDQNHQTAKLAAWLVSDYIHQRTMRLKK